MTLSEDARTAFTRPEVRVVIQAADRLVKVDRHGNADHKFYGQLVRVFLTFGVHPSVLARTEGVPEIRKRPTDRGDRYYLTWLRPKAQALRRHIEFEIPATMVGWLPDFIAKEKSHRTARYWELMKEVEWEVGQMGYHFKVNPLRFRHTSMREQIAKGVPATDVMAAYGVTYETLQRYALSTPEMRGEKMEQIGWGAW